MLATHPVKGLQFLRFATDWRIAIQGLLSRHDCLHREWSRDAYHTFNNFRLVHQLFLLGIRGDAGIDFVYLRPPGCTILCQRGLQGRSPVIVWVERDVPLFPALVRKLPAPSVSLGYRLLPLAPF